jgi:hypothetical protein
VVLVPVVRNARAEPADDLKPFGDDALLRLSTLLPDPKLGCGAAQAMLEINPEKAGPLIFASIPPADRNVQNVAFSYFLNRIYRGEKPPFLDQMHDAAVRCLKAGTNADAAELALYVVGMTGAEEDFELLEQYRCSPHLLESSWQRELYNAAEAALARLGHEEALANIQHELSYLGRKPLDRMTVETVAQSMLKAGFSRNERFVQLLAKFLYAPSLPHRPHDCVQSSEPSRCAGDALDKIVNGARPDAQYSTVDWKDWWYRNRSRYRGTLR